jgi:hypothetical protein
MISSNLSFYNKISCLYFFHFNFAKKKVQKKQEPSPQNIVHKTMRYEVDALLFDSFLQCMVLCDAWSLSGVT